MALLYPTTESVAIAEVRALLNEPVQGFWTDAEITNWLKLGSIDVSAKGLCYEVFGTLNLASASMLYSTILCSGSVNITDKVLKIHGAVLFESSAYRSLRQIHPRMVGQVMDGVTTGHARLFWRWGGKIGIFPTGALAAGASKVLVHFSKKTDVLTNIPDEWRPLVCLYAAAWAKMKERKYGEAMQFYQIYASQLNYNKAELMTRPPDSSDMLKLPDRTQIVSPG